MSLKTLPVVFINLSGEMMYILDQRLKAQSISPDKAEKVIHDIVSTMFNQNFIEELFKPQELYSKRALRSLFEKLAHASIMRLNAASMDKLYDLMTMVFKYQIYMCHRPQDIFLVTLNHLDAIRKYVTSSSSVVNQVDNVYGFLIKLYYSMSYGELQLLRQTLLSFFQDLQVRVSVFLKNGYQHPNGRFVFSSEGCLPYGFDIPGTITVYDADGGVKSKTKFHPGLNYVPSHPPGSLELEGERGTLLGTNIYSYSKSDEQVLPAYPPLPIYHNEKQDYSRELRRQEGCAQEELSLLAHLIGVKENNQCPEFTLSLLGGKEEEGSENHNVSLSHLMGEDRVVTINAGKVPHQKQLNEVLSDLSVEDQETKQEDILDLLDAAAS